MPDMAATPVTVLLRLLLQICLQTFVCTTSEKVLKEHFENRHAGKDFYDAFPHLKA